MSEADRLNEREFQRARAAREPVLSEADRLRAARAAEEAAALQMGGSGDIGAASARARGEQVGPPGDYNMKKGGIVKYQEGGRVNNADIPEERGPIGRRYNIFLNDLRAERRREQEEGRYSPDFEQRMARTAPSRHGPMRDPDAEDRAAYAGRRSAERTRRVGSAQNVQRDIERSLEEEGRRIGQRRYADPSKMEDAGFKKGGMVKPKAKPVAKKAGGMVAAKPKAAPKKMMKGGMVAKPKVAAKSKAKPMPFKKGGVIKKGKK
jgi:hypothetical protein